MIIVNVMRKYFKYVKYIFWRMRQISIRSNATDRPNLSDSVTQTSYLVVVRMRISEKWLLSVTSPHHVSGRTEGGRAAGQNLASAGRPALCVTNNGNRIFEKEQILPK